MAIYPLRHIPLLVAVYGFLAAQVPEDTYANFEGAQTNPVRLSPFGSRLFAVNTADARVSVFDIADPLNPRRIAEIPVGLEPVSVSARSEDEAWVVNQVSDSISVVSVSKRAVIDTLYVKDEPSDVVFAGDQAFISLSRSNQIGVFNARTRKPVKAIPVFGENPRALAVSADGTKVYAAFALSGNRTTVIPSSLAPPQPAPTNQTLPAPPKAALIVDAQDPAWTGVIKFRMPDNDVAEIDTRTLAVSRYYAQVGTVNLGIAVRPFTGDLFVSNTDARNRVRFEPNLRGRFVDNRVTRIRRQSVPDITPFNLNPGVPTLGTAFAQPAALVFDGLGKNLYVASFGTDRVGVLNPDTGAVIARIEIGPSGGKPADPGTKRGPRGLALHPFGRALYVLNRISNTIAVVDTVARTMTREIPVGSFDPTPLSIRKGRGFLYDAKLSGDGTASCASCHVDSDMDMLSWDLGDPGGEMIYIEQDGVQQPMHPMKGPMTTQTLRGLTNVGNLHWRGDRASFADFNGAFSSLMGGSLIASASMDEFNAFIKTIRFQPNPNQKLDRTLPTSFFGGNPAEGLNTFLTVPFRFDLTCNTCHKADPGPGTTGFIQFAPPQDQPFKVAQLRNVYQKVNYTPQLAESISGFGLLNDGTVASVYGLLSQPNFGDLAADHTRKINLAAFLLCFDTGTAPAVGYSRTFRKDNLLQPDLLADWQFLELQAQAGNIDLIGKGTILGAPRGILYRPATKDYIIDLAAFPPLSRAQVALAIQQYNDVFTLMGVPPSTGRRMAIDRDADSILDGDER